MNQLLVVLLACAFAFTSVSTFADDTSLVPLSKMSIEQAKVAKKEAEEKWAKMTPEEKAAAKKAARTKKQRDLTALDMTAQNEELAAEKSRSDRLWRMREFPTRPGEPGYRPPMTPEERKKAEQP
jgi:hypothetical protein